MSPRASFPFSWHWCRLGCCFVPCWWCVRVTCNCVQQLQGSAGVKQSKMQSSTRGRSLSSSPGNGSTQITAGPFDACCLSLFCLPGLCRLCCFFCPGGLTLNPNPNSSCSASFLSFVLQRRGERCPGLAQAHLCCYTPCIGRPESQAG